MTPSRQSKPTAKKAVRAASAAAPRARATTTRRSFTDYVMAGIEIVKLNEGAMRSVASEREALAMGVAVVALMGLAVAIGTLMPWMIFAIPFGIAGFFLGVGIYHLFALVLGGKATYAEYCRVRGLGYVLFWPMVIPIIGPFLGIFLSIWDIVVNITVLRTVHRLSTGRAVVVALVPIIVFTLFALVIAVIMITMFGGLFIEGWRGGMMGNRWY